MKRRCGLGARARVSATGAHAAIMARVASMRDATCQAALEEIDAALEGDQRARVRCAKHHEHPEQEEGVAEERGKDAIASYQHVGMAAPPLQEGLRLLLIPFEA